MHARILLLLLVLSIQPCFASCASSWGDSQAATTCRKARFQVVGQELCLVRAICPINTPNGTRWRKTSIQYLEGDNLWHCGLGYLQDAPCPKPIFDH